MQESICGRARRFSISAVITIVITLVCAFSIGGARAEPGGGGGGATCPTPYGPSEYIWYDMGSVGPTSASITFDLSSSSAMDIAIANLEWWDGVPGQTGSIGDIGIGEGPGVTETMTGLYPWMQYSFDIVASITCTDSSGTHSYSGEAVGNFYTPRMSEWTSYLAVGNIVAVDSLVPEITCTWTMETNFTIQSVNTESSGTWSITSGPYVQHFAASSSIAPSSFSGAKTMCADHAAGVTNNSSVVVGDFCSPNCNPGGVEIGYQYTWNPVYILVFDPTGGNPVSLTVSIVFAVTYYFDPSAVATVSETCISISLSNTWALGEYLLEVAHIALLLAEAS